MKKRFLLIMLASVLAFSSFSLTGCGKDDDEKEEKSKKHKDKDDDDEDEDEDDDDEDDEDEDDEDEDEDDDDKDDDKEDEDDYDYSGSIENDDDDDNYDYDYDDDDDYDYSYSNDYSDKGKIDIAVARNVLSCNGNVAYDSATGYSYMWCPGTGIIKTKYGEGYTVVYKDTEKIRSISLYGGVLYFIKSSSSTFYFCSVNTNGTDYEESKLTGELDNFYITDKGMFRVLNNGKMLDYIPETSDTSIGKYTLYKGYVAITNDYVYWASAENEISYTTIADFGVGKVGKINLGDYKILSNIISSPNGKYIDLICEDAKGNYTVIETDYKDDTVYLAMPTGDFDYFRLGANSSMGIFAAGTDYTSGCVTKVWKLGSNCELLYQLSKNDVKDIYITPITGESFGWITTVERDPQTWNDSLYQGFTDGYDELKQIVIK